MGSSTPCSTHVLVSNSWRNQNPERAHKHSRTPARSLTYKCLVKKSSHKAPQLRYFNPEQVLLCRLLYFFLKYLTGSLFVTQWAFSIAALKHRKQWLSHSKNKTGFTICLQGNKRLEINAFLKLDPQMTISTWIHPSASWLSISSILTAGDTRHL